MINFIDRALESYLRDQVPLPESTIGVSFDPPDKDWGAALNRPTLNVFLWDVSRSGPSMSTGMAQRVGENGLERRRTNPSIDFHYLLTAWATDVKDEHQVLGSVLQSVLRNRELPASLIPEGIADGACRINLAAAGDRAPSEFWSALGGRLKPGLQLQVTLPVPVHEWVAAPKPPESIDLGVEPLNLPQPEEERKARWAPAEGTTARRVRRNGAVTMEGRRDAPAQPADHGSTGPG